jgi:N-(2-amino-2-carboxyethyl)-L-glutamate synthase
MRRIIASPVSGMRDLIGGTPLVYLRNLSEQYGFTIYAKLESHNLGGSLKDRSAFSMVEHAIREGRIGRGSTIIESSSGNMGIGLAQACSHYGMHLICVVDARTNEANIKIMKAYGAKVERVTKPLTRGGSLLEARLTKVRSLLESIPGSFWPNQYANLANPKAHQKTMGEIDRALEGDVDYLFVAAGTCGTLRGCSEYARSRKMKTRIMAVDAKGSVIFGGPSLPRLVPGHGAAVRPAIFKPGMADEVIYVSDEDCIKGCHALVDQETILAGGSTGAVVSAMHAAALRIPQGSTVVLMCADRGERYMDTIYDEAWVAEHFPNMTSMQDSPQLPVDISEVYSR